MIEKGMKKSQILSLELLSILDECLRRSFEWVCRPLQRKEPTLRLPISGVLQHVPWQQSTAGFHLLWDSQIR